MSRPTSVELTICCPSCLNSHIHVLDMTLIEQGWFKFNDQCPACHASLIVTWELRGHVKFVRLANEPYPVVLSLDSFGDPGSP